MIVARNLLLGAVAVAMGTALIVLDPPAAVEREIRSVLPEFEPASLEEVILRGPGGAPRTTLRWAEGGGAPIVVEKHGAPARDVEVRVLLAELASMTDLDVVGVGADARDRFGLAGDGASSVELRERGGKTTSLSVATAEGGAAFVHVEGQERVLRVPRFRVPDPEPRRWFDSAMLIPLSRRQIREVRLSGEALAAPVTVRSRRGDLVAYENGDGEPVEERIATELLERVGLDTGLDVVPRPEVDSGGPAPLSLTVYSFDGKDFEVTIADLGQADAGRASGEQMAGIAFRSDLDFAFQVDPAWVQGLLEAAGAVR